MLFWYFSWNICAKIHRRLGTFSYLEKCLLILIESKIENHQHYTEAHNMLYKNIIVGSGH